MASNLWEAMQASLKEVVEVKADGNHFVKRGGFTATDESRDDVGADNTVTMEKFLDATINGFVDQKKPEYENFIKFVEMFPKNASNVLTDASKIFVRDEEYAIKESDIDKAFDFIKRKEWKKLGALIDAYPNVASMTMNASPPTQSSALSATAAPSTPRTLEKESKEKSEETRDDKIQTQDVHPDEEEEAADALNVEATESGAADEEKIKSVSK